MYLRRVDYPRRRQRQGGVFTSLCVCLSVFLHDISKIDAASIAKRDTEMFHDESWKPFIMLMSKGQRSRSRVTETLPAWVDLYTRVSAGFFNSLI